jgi:hypothetical protein
MLFTLSLCSRRVTGRFLARSLVAAAIFLLEVVYDQLSRDGFGRRSRGNLQSIIYYLRVLRPSINNLLLFVGITVSWTTLVRPVTRQIGHEVGPSSRAACTSLGNP